jgi:hypothetical protein
MGLEAYVVGESRSPRRWQCFMCTSCCVGVGIGVGLIVRVVSIAVWSAALAADVITL